MQNYVSPKLFFLNFTLKVTSLMSLITFAVEQLGNIDEDKVKALAKQAAAQAWNNNILNQTQMTSYKDVSETEAVPERGRLRIP